jgi:hypothetical protein
VGSSDIDSDAVGFGVASSLSEEFVSAKIARRTTPAITKKRTPFEFFFAGADGAATDFAGAGVLVTVVAPRVGTGGITILDASTLAEDFLATARLAGAFLAGRFAALVDFFAAFFAGRFAAAFFTGRFARDFAGRFAAFFFAATTTPSFIPNPFRDQKYGSSLPSPLLTAGFSRPDKWCDFWGDLAQRSASMTDGIFQFWVHLRCRNLISIRLEDGVISKSILANRLVTYRAVNFAANHDVAAIR